MERYVPIDTFDAQVGSEDYFLHRILVKIEEAYARHLEALGALEGSFAELQSRLAR